VELVPVIDVRHLIQDLRAEAPNASAEHGQLMRDAAVTLDRYKHLIGNVQLGDAEVGPAPIPPPDLGPSNRGHRVKGAPCG
jgi:hypothetical protein